MWGGDTEGRKGLEVGCEWGENQRCGSYGRSYRWWSWVKEVEAWDVSHEVEVNERAWGG